MNAVTDVSRGPVEVQLPGMEYDPTRHGKMNLLRTHRCRSVAGGVTGKVSGPDPCLLHGSLYTGAV